MSYNDVKEHCTGRVDIVRNVIRKVPQAFFFKNSMTGPFNVYENVFSDMNAVSIVTNSSNINFTNNLVINSGGFTGVGDADSVGNVQEWINANNLYVANNTFVGLGGLINHVFGSGHLYESNVYFDIGSVADDHSYNSSAYIRKSQYLPDPVDISKSRLHGLISNKNCFISNHDKFLFVKQNTTAGWLFYDQFEANTTFGFDTESEFHFGLTEEMFFNDPEDGDYTLKDPALCPGMGYR